MGDATVLVRLKGAYWRLRHALVDLIGPLRRNLRDMRRIAGTGGWGTALRMMAQRARYALLAASGRGQSEEELARVSMEYWNQGDRAGVDLKDFSHWKGEGPWKDDANWLRLGRVHRRMYEQAGRLGVLQRPARRIIEWGSGGGANAIHFIDEASEYCGVEIAQASLDECGRVLAEAGFRGYRPVFVPATSPEDVLKSVDGGFDFFLCTYVFELLPGKGYCERVLGLAERLLRPGGCALIQIRYDDGSDRSSQKNVDYFRNSTRFTSFRVEEFWLVARRAGFEPVNVVLVPEKTPDFSGDLYAYFTLVKPAPDAQAGRSD